MYKGASKFKQNLRARPYANKDCILLMWTTDPFLQKSFEVIESWGFTYKTVGFVWAKLNRKSSGWFKLDKGKPGILSPSDQRRT
jgi:N6-adenosine-specific RNA methylase IME4